MSEEPRSMHYSKFQQNNYEHRLLTEDNFFLAWFILVSKMKTLIFKGHNSYASTLE